MDRLSLTSSFRSVSTSTGCGWRVRSSSTDKLPRDTDLVAKIYDPLYWDHDQDDADPFLCVDRAYSCETAAYTALSKLQGKTIPRYFGSFSIKMCVDTTNAGTTFRLVRLILIEFIPGRSIEQLSSANLSQSIRQSIMKEVIDAESLIYTHNIWHSDIRPANILVRDDLKARRVTTIDFGKCTIGRHPLPFLHEEYLPNVPISPLLRWSKPRGHFGSWIDWDWLPWLQRVYEPTRASITEYMKSRWLPRGVEL